MALGIRPVHKRIFFLLFAAYLLCSVLVVAFDRDRVTPSKTCALCFMNGSLSSAVGQSHVTGEVYCRKEYLPLAEETCRICGLTSFAAVWYRGPPLLPASI
jgi:hypothetical protein